MKNNILLVSLSLFLFSCASNKNAKKKMYTSDGREIPNWIYNQEEGCSNAYLCATGEGESLSDADAKSQSALASIFESHVESQFDVHKTSMTENEKERVKRSINSDVKVTVNQIIKGAVIASRFEKDAVHFSFAKLSKSKAANIILVEISKIDDELKFLYEKRSRTSILRMLVLLDRRNVLAEKAIVLDRKVATQSITFSKVQSLKFNSGSSRKLSLKVKAGVPVTISKYLGELLNQVGYQLVNKGPEYSVSISHDAKQEYLNVKGFSKYTFSIIVTARNSSKKQLGSFVVSKTTTGRNKQDAYLKAKNEIRKELKNNLEKLNLD